MTGHCTGERIRGRELPCRAAHVAGWLQGAHQRGLVVALLAQPGVVGF